MACGDTSWVVVVFCAGIILGTGGIIDVDGAGDVSFKALT